MTTATALDSWIAFRKPNPQARLRLFCFPYAGAGASIFRTWPDGLPADVEICPVQYPGRGTRPMETPFTEISSLVRALAQAMLPLVDKPFAFFGHSLGALVAFELAQELRRQSSLQPARLFVSADRAPQIPRRNRPIHALPEGEFLAELRRLNGIPGKAVGGFGTHAAHASHAASRFRRLRDLYIRNRTTSRLPHLQLWRLAGSKSEPWRPRVLARSNERFLLTADVSRRPFLHEHNSAAPSPRRIPRPAQIRVRTTKT